MKRFSLALALLAGLPGVAQAQAVNVRMEKAAPPAQGITATGTATEKIPAADATLTIRIISTSGQPPTVAQLDTVSDALVKAGVDPKDISKPNTMGASVGPSMSSLTATIHSPTATVMKQAIDATRNITSSPQFPFSFSRVQLHAPNCTDAFTRARAVAIEKTKIKAAAIAKQMGVTLGKIQALSDEEQTAADGSCTSEFGIGPGSAEFMSTSGQPSPDDYASVIVTSTVTITYAIK